MPNPTPRATPTPTTEPVSTMLTPTSGGSIVDAAGNTWTLTVTRDVVKNGQRVQGGGDIAALTYSDKTIFGKDGTSSHWYIYNSGIWQGPVAAPPTAAP
jgi:Neuraminidase (sialidase)